MEICANQRTPPSLGSTNYPPNKIFKIFITGILNLGTQPCDYSQIPAANENEGGTRQTGFSLAHQSWTLIGPPILAPHWLLDYLQSPASVIPEMDKV